MAVSAQRGQALANAVHIAQLRLLLHVLMPDAYYSDFVESLHRLDDPPEPCRFIGQLNGSSSLFLCRELPSPSIQEGVIIENNRIAAPLSIGVGTYSLWLPRYTLYHYDSFFMLPILCIQQTSWENTLVRSLLAQKLLHFTGKRIAFYPIEVLIVVDNYQRKKGIGLLQRLYQPYFGMTIFCGSYNQLEYSDGGYFLTGDDAIFNFWHKLNHSEILFPFEYGNYGSRWWRSIYGGIAAKRASQIFEQVSRTNTRVKKILECYKNGLNENGRDRDALKHIASDTGNSVSDFFYVPQKRLAYVTELIEVFFEAGLFVELTILKILQTVPHNSSPHRPLKLNENSFVYINYRNRHRWYDFYNSNIIMIHPIKINQFVEMKPRKR
ncbi:unnamed protein product [Cylicocyclus nassatus]|uniref:Uncharacterized protein n=1 Tax=Cylicocyclus nassatus TaxID=53992 RepID=A0AA36H9S0_CYLNA|nr:unnamed protein product [Cylicocyclus nassatus]